MSSRSPISISRRRLLASLTAAAATLAIGACAPAPAPTATPAPKPAPEPAKPAAAPATPTPAPKPAEAPKPAPAGPSPTPTLPASSVAYTAGYTKLLMRVHWSGQIFADFLKLVDEYNAGQGKEDKTWVELQRFLAGTFTQQMSNFIADFQAGTSEDIYHLFNALFPDMADKGLFNVPPPEIQAYVKENYYPGPIFGATWKGQVYGYPTENQPSVLYMTKELFAKAGLDATKDYPKNWNDLREISKKLIRLDGGKKVGVGLAWPEADWRHLKDRVYMHWTEGEQFIDEEKHTVNLGSEVGRAITDLWHGMAVTDGSTSVGLGTQADSYNKKVAGMVFMDAWVARFWIRDQGGQPLLDDQHTVPFPSRKGGNEGTIEHHYTLLVGTKSKSREAAWRFLRWMNEKPAIRMQKFQTDVFGFAPSHKGYKMPDLMPEQMRKAFEAVVTKGIALPRTRGIPRVQEILMKHQQDLAFGKVDPKQFTENATKEINAALKDVYES